jgi:DNA repair exonuclease SbcCD ATPase subunit
MTTFKTIRYKNFLSAGNIFTEINLQKEEHTLIIGENGAGKSTILDAITFALFGKPFRNINKPQIINSVNGRDCVVEVEFKSLSKDYKIVRGLKPNVFEIYCDGDLVDQDAKSKDYQDYLEKHILKFNYKAFTQIVILGSSSFVPFMQLSAADRRAIIEDLLDIQIFSAMNQVVKERNATLKNEATKLKSDIDSTVAQIEMQKKYIEEAKKNNQDQIDVKEQELKENQEQLEKLQNDSALIQKHVDTLLKTITDEKKVKDKNKKLSQFEAKIDNNITKLQKDIDFFNNNDTCPTCDQSINNKEEKVEQYTSKMNEFSEGMKKLKEEQDAVLRRINNIEAVNKNILSHQSEITRINASYTQIQKYVKKLEKEIEDLKGKKVLSDDMMNISQELYDKLTQLQTNKATLIDRKKYIDVAAYLLKDSGIKAKIVKQYLPIINKLVNKYLASMNFFVNFEIDEEFKESIKSRHRDDFSYENFSEGEKQKIDLSLLFTWRAIAKMKNSINTNILLLDEVFDSSLDANGTESLLQILHTLPDNTNIFVISHKDSLHDKFKNILKFEKRKGFSVLV